MFAPPNVHSFHANGYSLAAWTKYGIRWWQNDETGDFWMQGAPEMLPPLQYGHYCRCQEYLQGAPLDVRIDPMPWLAEADLAVLLQWDLENFQLLNQPRT